MTNIKIITDSGRYIDYISPKDLNIKLNRKADDLQDPSARFGEYSYTFGLPKTKNNNWIFGFANVPSVRRKFKQNPISIKVYNNNNLLLTGQLELKEITDDEYKCNFYSKLTQLIDDLKDKNMQDITSCPKIAWGYEDTIRGHINSGFTSCDDTSYQFPYVYYNTNFCPTSVFSGLTDTVVDYNGTTDHVFQRQRAWQNWYYIINHTFQGENEYYYHQFPLAFYLKSMVEYMFEDIGWNIGGSFWQDNNIKKIIVPYVGETDVYDRAVYCTAGGTPTGTTCTTGTLMLDTSKFMPDYDCSEFLSDVINTFNLFLNIDVNNKIINFETYDVMFGNKTNPYDITDKIDSKTVTVSKVDDYDPSIKWDEIENKRILGDNWYISSTGTSAYSITYSITDNNSLFDKVFNHIGETDGEIRIGFGAPAVKRMRIRNRFNINDIDKDTTDHVLFMPYISEQFPEDNLGNEFSKDDSNSTVYNDESMIDYKGKPTLYYYYGVSGSNLVQRTAKGSQSDFFFVNFDDVNQKLPFSSPFALTSYRDTINSAINGATINPTGSTNDDGVMLAGYMQGIYLMMANTSGQTTVTDVSLVFSDNNTFGETLYTKYYYNRFKRYAESEILQAEMYMTDNDWREMTINQPVKYNKELYSIMEIGNYDIVKQTANIKLIKML